MLGFLRKLGFIKSPVVSDEVSDALKLQAISNKAQDAYMKSSDSIASYCVDTNGTHAEEISVSEAGRIRVRGVKESMIRIFEDPTMSMKGDHKSGTNDNWGSINTRGRRDFGG